MNEDLLLALGFHKEVARFKDGKCPWCDEKVNMGDFTDPLSLKEYRISGLCQSCQDDFFEGAE